mgnify:CR=1 FL=1
MAALLDNIDPEGLEEFSVVFTDWLSMMAALGVGFRPTASRARPRRAS